MATSVRTGIYLSFVISFICVCFVHCVDDDFQEEVLINPLPSGHIYFQFQFTTVSDVNLYSKNTHQHYHLFPKSLGEVLEKYSVQELHLSLTQGLWRYEKWGYPVTSAPPGAELWVWFKEDTPNIDDTWTDLINVLSGMFCASLNFMDKTATVNPKYSFRAQGATSDWFNKRYSKNLRYAALPRENVCTENLTPWKKLLPCGAKTGLASLFNALKLYDASYHSLGIHYRPVCKDDTCSETSSELTQSMGVVFDPTIMSAGKTDWSLRRLFGWHLATSCPLASSSKIYLDVTSNKTLEYYFNLIPEPTEIIKFTRGDSKRKYAVYNVPDFTSLGVLPLAAKHNKLFEYKPIEPPILYAHRFQTGYGQDKGGIKCLIYNNHPTKDITVVYMETVPWFLRLYYHTLKIQTFRDQVVGANGTDLKPLKSHYIPGRERQQPYFLELVLKLPAQTVTKISMEFDRALLKWTEYPPDANHGFYVDAAVISAMVPTANHYTATPQASSRLSSVVTDQSESFFVRLHTETLLVTLPTPDFSMPYNTICLVSTVIAIAFGSIHNLTTRRFVEKDPSKQKGILAKIKGFFIKGKKKATEQGEKDDVSENSAGDMVKENKENEERGGDIRQRNQKKSQKSTSNTSS